MMRSLFCLLPLVLLVSASPAERLPDQAIETCTRQLNALSRALNQYECDHRKLPGQLSDLYPRYIRDKAMFHCPADPTEGEPGREYAHKDPRMPLSYSYQFSADPLSAAESWLAVSYLGPYSASEIPGKSWGSGRHVNTQLRSFYGDRVPVIRCFHHQPEDSEAETVLNLTRTGKVYRSGVRWQNQPDTVAVVLERYLRDLKSGPKSFKKRWFGAGAMEGYAGEWLDDPRVQSLRPKLLAIVAGLRRLAERQPPREKSRTLRVAGRLLNAVGEYRQTIPLLQESLRLLARFPDDKWGLKGGPETLILADAYRGLGQHQKMIPLYQERLKKQPGNRGLLRLLADAYAAVGQSEKAEALRLRADPGQVLVGKTAPDFTLPTPTGGQVSLSEALKGKKALLVNFWFYG